MSLPGLTQPVQLHSMRMYKCSLANPSLCSYQSHIWRFWYEADHQFALSTVYFFITAIGLFTIRRLARETPLYRTGKSTRLRSVYRWLSYRGLRLERLNYNSSSLGVILLGISGFVFFAGMTLGPQPYYWPKIPTGSFGGSPPLATRAGWMSLGCLPFVLATSSKVNMITAITGVSHERLQVFHRWSASAMLVLALIHTFPFIIRQADAGQLSEQWTTSMFYWTGVAALIPQAWCTMASAKPIRSLSYELFKFLHFFGAALFIVFFFIHCNFRLSSWDYFIAAAAIYVPCFLYSIIRTYAQYGVLKATLTTTDNDFIRVSVPIDAHWQPGQHYFLRFASFGMHALTTHPFTACSLPTPHASRSELVFYIRAQKGFTRRLFNVVEKNQGTSANVLLDGPYGGVESFRLAQPGRHLVIAGGSGAGWSLPLIERIVQFQAAAARESRGSEKEQFITPTQSLRIVLASRETATRLWFRDQLNNIIARYADDGVSASSMAVNVHFTGPPVCTCPSNIGKSPDACACGALSKDVEKAGLKLHDADTSSMSSDEQLRQDATGVSLRRAVGGRPHLPTIIAQEAAAAGDGGLSVYACGPLSMQQDIREACAAEQFTESGKRGGVFMHLEHFDWA